MKITSKARNPRVFILNDTSVTGHPGCVKVVSNLIAGLERNGLNVIARCPVGVDPFLWPSTRLHFHSVDAIIVNAEGTIHHTARRPKARKLAAIAKRIKSKRVLPVYAVNATIEELETTDIESMKSFDGIYVRESKSQSYLQDNGINANYVQDLTLADEYVRVSTARKGMFVSDSVLADVARALNHFAMAIGTTSVAMRPQRRWAYPHYCFNRDSLGKFADAYIDKIRRSEGVVTGRFHTVLFCIATDTPFLAIGSNSGKITSVLEDVFGESSRLIDVRDMKQVTSVPDFTSVELAQLASYRASALTGIENMFRNISELVSNSTHWHAS